MTPDLARLGRLVRRDLPDAVLGLLADPLCAGCAVPGAVLCRGCRDALAGPVIAVGPHGGPHTPPARAAAVYDGVVRSCLTAWKERGRHDVEPFLGDALAAALRALLAAGPALPAGGGVLVVPVPSSRAARRRRGADGVLRLARHAAAQLRRQPPRGVPWPPGAVRVVPALTVARRVADQAGLSAGERAANVSGAFRARAAATALVRGRDVVLVDDVLTTGATVHEAARALAAVGAGVVGVACVSTTPLRRGLSARAAVH